jgi:hypothetical protein
VVAVSFDFINAAQQDKLPASDLPTATATGGTRSASSAPSGSRPQAAAHPAASPAAKPSRSTSAASDGPPVAANARFGIPCVY